MSRVHVITGSASGIGAATAARLRQRGDKVIGVDIKDAEIIADLSTPDGRAAMIKAVGEMAPDGIDSVLTSAGSASFDRPGFVLATNYFGTTATLEGLHPLLRKPGARCVAVASTALLQANDETVALENLCLAGDEAGAVALAEEQGFLLAYPGAKRALASWASKTAVQPDWGGAGILLNTVAPGIIRTPMAEKALANPDQSAKMREFSPMAVENYAEADDVAELLEFLLTCKTNHLIGQVIFLDSGTQAILGSAK